jgi:hypothetical protein
MAKLIFINLPVSDLARATGSATDDLISGLAGSDTINEGAGNDIVLPGAGLNHTDGGSGTDTLSYAGSAVGVTADLQTGIIRQTGAAVGETAVNFENFIGTDYTDTVTGTTAPTASRPAPATTSSTAITWAAAITSTAAPAWIR